MAPHQARRSLRPWVERDGARTQGVERDRARGLEIEQDGARVLRSGETKPAPEGSGEVETASSETTSLGSGEAEPTALSETPMALGSGKMEPAPKVLGEAEPTHLGISRSYGCTLDCSDESMLMVISLSSSGTLVLVPDSSP